MQNIVENIVGGMENKVEAVRATATRPGVGGGSYSSLIPKDHPLN